MACGGKSAATSQNAGKAGDSQGEVAHPAAGPAGERPPGNDPPIKVDVKIVRVGDSVRLDISGAGRHRPARHAMERPDNWIVYLLADNQMMPRTVNGSVKVERFEVGNPAHKLWDIEVKFSMAYAIPHDAKELTVRITAPESPMFERTVPTSAVETMKSKLDEEREREAEKARIKAEKARIKAEKREKRRKARREKRKREKRKRERENNGDD